MANKSRNKGKTGEREFINLLSSRLPGCTLARNLMQTREGGHDVDGLDDWAIEIKRQETLSIGTWWRQATKQAQEASKRPALAYRQSREPWRILVEMSLDEFADYIGREYE